MASIIRVSGQEAPSGRNWNPTEGDAFRRMLGANAALSAEEKERLVEDTLDIMGDCVSPAAGAATNTGLVIGYVQSGKTLSFTGLAAMARDNRFRLVILLAGTTNNLVEQSFDRIKKDLDIDGTREWKLLTTQQKSFQSAEVDRVTAELSRWRNGNSRAKTLLIITMKQHQHLEQLTKLLSGIDFSDCPTLIIDDEGDQAGLNTKAKKAQESTTYARILGLRALFVHHSYVLYTATPQAPLLISRIDTLSPDFGQVLTPGTHYVGGRDFFLQGADRYVELIPVAEVPDKLAPPLHPPPTLLSALRDFIVGVAIGLLEEDDLKGNNRSMMVHPAVPKDDHLMFARWVRQTKDQWCSILRDTSHPDHDALVADFSDTASGLLRTYATNFTFDDIRSQLVDALESTAIAELNTREKNRIPSVDWRGEYSWILVGGIGLDRGFTVEGLTVSYMPRSTGVGNADNIQQRARFFGYKRRYLGLCRIYLTSENIDAFTDYVTHEDSVRGEIIRHLADGNSLKDWRRTYFLDQPLKPTRSSVVLLEMYQSRGKGGWVSPDHPHEDSEIVGENRETVDAMLGAFDLREYSEPGWNSKQVIPSFSDRIHLAELLPHIGRIRYKWPDDNLQHSSILLMLAKLASEDPDMLCSLYAFSGPWSGVPAMRSLNLDRPAKIKNLFQGSNASTNFPGARALISNEAVTFQLHRYDLQTADKKRMLKDVPVLAVHIPDPLIARVWVER